MAIDVDDYAIAPKRKRGAPDGGMNYRNGRLFTDALRRVLVQQDGKRLRAVVEAMVTKAESGDTAMIALIMDRVDGKARSMLEMRVEQVVEEMTDDDIRRAIAENQRFIAARAGAGDTLEGEEFVTVVSGDDAVSAAAGSAP